MAQRSHDPRQVLIKARKLPLSLLTDPVKENKIRILDVEKYEDTFGPKSRRKKVKLNSATYEDMLEAADDSTKTYTLGGDNYLNKDQIEEDNKLDNVIRDKRMEAG